MFAGFDDPAFKEFMRSGGGGETASGVHVTPRHAMKNTTVLRCVALLSFSVGQLPLHLREKETKLVVREHPLFRVLHRRPNGWQTAFEFRSYMQQCALGAVGSGHRGDAFARIVRSRGRVIGLIPFHPDRITPRQRTDLELEYVFQPNGGAQQVLPQSEVFHLRFGLSEDGVTGLSLVKQAAEAIGLALQTERAAARLFKNGNITGGVLEHPDRLSPESYDRLQTSLADRAGAENAHRDMILEEGMKYAKASQTGRDSQAIENRKHQIEDIARAFGVPRPLLGVDETSWGSGIDVLGQFFVRYGLNPWFDAWQQAIERDLLSEKEAGALEAKFNANALLHGALKDQAEFFARGLGAGGHQPWLHPDEPREWLDMPSRNDLPAPAGQMTGEPK